MPLAPLVRRALRLPVSLPVALLLAFTLLQAQAAIDASTAEALMRKSGTWEQLSSLGPQARAGLLAAVEQTEPRPDAAEVGRLTRLIDRAYAADALRATSRALMAREIEARHVPALQRWFDTRLGQAISRMEEAASADDRMPEALIREGAALLAEASPARRALIEEQLRVTHTVELMTRMHISSVLAAQKGAASVAPKPGGPSEAELRAQLEAERPKIQEVFGMLALAGAAKMYDPLPTDDLEKYVAFLKSEAGQHFNDVGVRALEAALTEAATEFGRGLPALRSGAGS